VPGEIWTIGHSTHPLDELLALLRAHRIELLADVRSYPGSRRMPWFSRESLAAELGEGYVHLRELGGRRRAQRDSPNGGWESEGFRGYADHMASAEFTEALARLEGLAHQRRTAVMCAEAPWWRCHRRLLADALLVRGWRVLHIGPDGRLVPHELTPFAAVEEGRITYPPPQLRLGDG
jgi:uncharacterized protein (DUF488 family)